MKRRELVSVLGRLGYDSYYEHPTGDIMARNIFGRWVNLCFDKHSKRGWSNEYVEWLPISYIIWVLERTCYKADLGEICNGKIYFHCDSKQKGVKY